ncbi:MAG: sugar phosphate isomerase/epimerase, partial [Acidobacteriota bacterium]|nr:sugar phosphate isomerase/epimerase [Acidobacteriota bacterium]
MRRREFLQSAMAGTAMAQAAAAQNPPKSDVGRGIKLGFDTYSVRAFKWKDIQLLDFAASLKVDTIQISDSGDYSSTDPAHLRQVKDHASRLGIQIDAGIGCICPLAKGWKPGEGTPEEVMIAGLK